MRVPLNDAAALDQVARAPHVTAGVRWRSSRARAGFTRRPSTTCARRARICDEQGWLLMLDEVQCGMGRTGKWFAHQWAGIVPDVMPLAKGLGSGVPVGAVVCNPRGPPTFGPGNHGTTFGGNPLAMRPASRRSASWRDGLLANAAEVGAALKAGLERELGGVAGVTEIRGQGLMLGIELDRPCGILLGRAADAGLMISVTADRVIRLVPPLILSARRGPRRWCHPGPAGPRFSPRRRHESPTRCRSPPP